MNNDNAQQCTHQIVFIEENTNRSVDAQFWKRIGQQERKHENLSAGEAEPGQRISRRDAQHHRADCGDDCNGQGLHDRGDQTLLRKHEVPPFKAPFRGENIGNLIYVAKSCNAHVHQRAVKEQHKDCQQNKFQKFFSCLPHSKSALDLDI